MQPPTERDKLKLAFSVHVSQMIVEADGVLDYGEMRVLGRFFPTSMLAACGFVDTSGGFTAEYDAFRHRALRELPKLLSIEEKLELIAVFHKTCMADGELAPAEVSVLQDAAALLGVPRPVMEAHLDLITLGPGADVPPVRN